jgi:hypothetical protein
VSETETADLVIVWLLRFVCIVIALREIAGQLEERWQLLSAIQKMLFAGCLPCFSLFRPKKPRHEGPLQEVNDDMFESNATLQVPEQQNTKHGKGHFTRFFFKGKPKVAKGAYAMLEDEDDTKSPFMAERSAGIKEVLSDPPNPSILLSTALTQDTTRPAGRDSCCSAHTIAPSSLIVDEVDAAPKVVFTSSSLVGSPLIEEDEEEQGEEEVEENEENIQALQQPEFESRMNAALELDMLQRDLSFTSDDISHLRDRYANIDDECTSEDDQDESGSFLHTPSAIYAAPRCLPQVHQPPQSIRALTVKDEVKALFAHQIQMPSEFKKKYMRWGAFLGDGGFGFVVTAFTTYGEEVRFAVSCILAMYHI